MVHYWGLGNLVLVEYDDLRAEKRDESEDVVSDDLQAVKEDNFEEVG